MVAFLPGFDSGVYTIRDLYTIPSGLPKVDFAGMNLSFEKVSAVLPDAFTIAILAAIESLLSCVVADSMVNSRHNSNAELVGQGIGNIASVLFGGIPATGAIARTAANANNGGRTPVAGMVHAIVLLLVLLFLMPYAGLIPMPTIAAILFMVAYNMSEWKKFVSILKTAPKSDILILIVTFVLTVIFDLVVAIAIGMVLTAMLFIKRMSDETSVNGWKYIDPDTDMDGIELKVVPKDVRVYEISGPLFFGAADKIPEIILKDYTRCLILRMRAVPSLDSTALNALELLYKKCQKQNVRLILSHVNEQPLQVMRKSGFYDMVGEENFSNHIDDALSMASESAQ
jgi:SulP family sulfate permease